MRHLRKVGLAVMVLASTASAALAQRTVRTSNAPAAQGGFWEFGLDFAGVTVGMDKPKSLSTGFGFGTLRGGRYISDIMSIEPQVTFSSFSADGIRGSSFVRAEVGLLYHLQAERTTQQMYVRPMLALSHSSGGGAGANATGLGIGAGIKKPAKNTRFTWRGEANIARTLKHGPVNATTDVNLMLGASVYSK